MPKLHNSPRRELVPHGSSGLRLPAAEVEGMLPGAAHVVALLEAATTRSMGSTSLMSSCDQSYAGRVSGPRGLAGVASAGRARSPLACLYGGIQSSSRTLLQPAGRDKSCRPAPT